jgi:hypothetical protein
MKNSDIISFSIKGSDGIWIPVSVLYVYGKLYISCSGSEFKQLFGDFIIKVHEDEIADLIIRQKVRTAFLDQLILQLIEIKKKISLHRD